MLPFRSRMSRRLLAAVALCAGATACDIGPASRTRPAEALLTQDDLARVRSVTSQQQAGGVAGPGAAGSRSDICGEVEGVFAQLQVIGGGRLRFSGTGQLAMDANAWSRVPAEQRTMLLKALAVQNRCKTGIAKGTALVREVDGPRIIGRYREP